MRSPPTAPQPRVAGAKDVPRALIRAVWGTVVLLAILGVGAAILRGVFIGDLTSRVEPSRERLLSALDRSDPFESERAAEVRRVDSRYAAHPGLTLLHVIPGGLLLILAPLQFSRRLRSHDIRFHRWSGRVVLVAAVLVVLPGVYFGIVVPFGGAGEAVATVVFGGFFLAALGRAFVAIRKRQIALHREWMLRAFAIAIGVATMRVIAPLLDITLTPAGYRPAQVFVLSLWTGWAITLGGAELWIRYTRAHLAATTAVNGAAPIPLPAK